MWQLKLLFAIVLLSTVGTTPNAAQEVDLKVIAELGSEEIRERLTEGLKEYEKQLQSVLRTRLPEEKDFVGRIVWLVQEEHIPKNLVDSAWLWVRKNRAYSKYPFVYFERVLRLQAEKAKVVLPAFDRKAYGDRFSQRNFQKSRLQNRRR